MGQAPGDNTSGAAIGAIIAGRYQIVAQLGTGGMGAVYQAKQLSMDRMVALKLIHPHIAAQKDVAGRFQREMQATSKIEHPNTIRVLDFGTAEDGQLFVATELLDGRSLGALLTESGPLPLTRLLHIAAQVVRALGAAHQEGIAHCDLTPDNVMLLDRHGERDIVKVLDFGIARFADAPEEQPAAADGRRTAAYRSPEQASGAPVDHRADFYALGVMLFQMATGQLPFEGAARSASETPPRPSSLVPVPAPLEALILRLLARAPGERPASAAELLALVEGCRPGGTTTPPSSPETSAARATASTAEASGARSAASKAEPAAASPRQRRRRSRWPIVAVVAALAGGALVVTLTATRHARRQAATEAARRRLDDLERADGDPLPPASCRTADPGTVTRLARAAGLLAGATAGTPRPQDKEALALLSAAPAPGATPAATEGWTLLARARLATEPDADDALADAVRASAACPDFAVTHELVGNAEQRRGHADAARAAYERALALAPSYLAPRFNLGLLALHAGDAASALTAFDAVLMTEPSHPRAHLARGQAHLQLGHVASALADLGVATERRPDDADAWLLLGQARARAGTPESARAAFCQAKALGSADAARHCP